MGRFSTVLAWARWTQLKICYVRTLSEASTHVLLGVGLGLGVGSIEVGVLDARLLAVLCGTDKVVDLFVSCDRSTKLKRDCPARRRLVDAVSAIDAEAPPSRKRQTYVEQSNGGYSKTSDGVGWGEDEAYGSDTCVDHCC